MQIERCEIHSGHENGLLISKESIVNCNETVIKDHLSAQVAITEKSFCSMKDCLIVNGRHVGIYVEKNRSVCSSNVKLRKTTIPLLMLIAES